MSDLDLLGITAVTNSSVTLQFKSFANLYSQLRSRVGDGGPTSFSVEYEVYNARTGARLVRSGIRTITSASPNYGGTSEVRSGLAARTPYWATVRVRNPETYFVRRCFMTGGTYTPSNESGQPGYSSQLSSGCFSISPRTFQDIRNCLCGRSRIWTNDAQNTAQRRTLGCANAN